MFITIDTVHLYAEPSANATIKARLAPNQTLPVYGTPVVSDGWIWHKVNIPGNHWVPEMRVDGIQQLLVWTGINSKPMPVQEKTIAQPVIAQSTAVAPATSVQSATTAVATAEETRVRVAAFGITSRFEGGGYGTYQNYDEGIVSYGRFQFTVKGGLYTVLKEYTEASTSQAAGSLQAYLSRVQSTDESLRNDESFKALLKEAAEDPVMQTTQDKVATRIYWDKIHEIAITPRAFKLPLTRALLFDIAINFGMGDAFVRRAEREAGVSEGSVIGENGVTEEQLITQVAALRKASHDRQAERDNLPGLKVRGDFWVNLIAANDWQLQGDADGNILVKSRALQVKNPEITVVSDTPTPSPQTSATQAQTAVTVSVESAASAQVPEETSETSPVTTRKDEASETVADAHTTPFQVIEETSETGTTPSEDTASVPEMIIQITPKGNKGVNIRSAPNTTGSVVAVAKANDILVLVDSETDREKIGQSGQWVQVRHADGTEGYTAGWLFEIYEDATTEAEPQTDNAISETVSEINEDAIVSERILTIVAKSNKGVNIRSAPNTTASVVAVARADAILEVLDPEADGEKIGQSGQWVQVCHADGIEGYTAGWLFEIYEDKTIETEPEPAGVDESEPESTIEAQPDDEESVSAPELDEKDATFTDGDADEDEAFSAQALSDEDDDDLQLDTSEPVVSSPLAINPDELVRAPDLFAVVSAPVIPEEVEAPSAETPAATETSVVSAIGATGMNLDLYHPLGTPDPAALGNIKWVRFLYNVSFNPEIPEGNDARYGNTDLDATMQRYRPILEKYANAGKKVLLVFTHQTYGEGQGFNLGDLSDEQWRELSDTFAEMVASIAEQYGDANVIHGLQIWNEQDAPEGAVASIPLRPSVYGYMLGKTIQAVRQVNKTIPIITGGHASGPGTGAPYAKETIANMPDGVRPSGIAFHPYGRGDLKSEAKYRHFGNIDESVAAYAAVLPDIPLWITEWGVLDAPSEPPEGIGKYAQEFVERLREGHDGKIVAAMWYAWAQGMHNGYGVVDTEGNPRPPFTALFTSL